MEAASTTHPSVLHQNAAAFASPVVGVERRIGFAVRSDRYLALVAVMGVVGLSMRLAQATVVDLSPAWFYRLMTLHGVGMITGSLLAMMGALWYVLHPSEPLRVGRMLTCYGAHPYGRCCRSSGHIHRRLRSRLRFSCLRFLSIQPAKWSVWSESVFLSGQLLVGAGFCIFYIDVLQQTTTTYGGLERTLGLRFLRGREPERAQPPQAIAATVIAIDGLISCAVGSTIIIGLLGRTYDHTVGIEDTGHARRERRQPPVGRERDQVAAEPVLSRVGLLDGGGEPDRAQHAQPQVVRAASDVRREPARARGRDLLLHVPGVHGEQVAVDHRVDPAHGEGDGGVQAAAGPRPRVGGRRDGGVVAEPVARLLPG